MVLRPGSAPVIPGDQTPEGTRSRRKDPGWSKQKSRLLMQTGVVRRRSKGESAHAGHARQEDRHI